MLCRVNSVKISLEQQRSSSSRDTLTSLAILKMFPGVNLPNSAMTSSSRINDFFLKLYFRKLCSFSRKINFSKYILICSKFF